MGGKGIEGDVGRIEGEPSLTPQQLTLSIEGYTPPVDNNFMISALLNQLEIIEKETRKKIHSSIVLGDAIKEMSIMESFASDISNAIKKWKGKIIDPSKEQKDQLIHLLDQECTKIDVKLVELISKDTYDLYEVKLKRIISNAINVLIEEVKTEYTSPYEPFIE